jgi:hypothetical protein
MHGKITRYLGKITRYLRLESASRVTAESAVAPAVTALSRPSLHSLNNRAVPRPPVCVAPWSKLACSVARRECASFLMVFVFVEFCQSCIVAYVRGGISLSRVSGVVFT